MSDDIPDGHSTSSSSSGSDSDTMTMKNLDVIVHNAVHYFQFNSANTLMIADGVLCEVCHSTEPESLASGTEF